MTYSGSNYTMMSWYSSWVHLYTSAFEN